jgi:DNA-binding MarR family transcriptional regulator
MVVPIAGGAFVASFPEKDGRLCFIRDFIMQVGGWIGQCSKDMEQACGLGKHEMALLLILEHSGPLPVKELARHLGEVSLSTMTRMLDRMEEQMLITRSLDPEDRRSFKITVSEQGIELAKRYTGQVDSVVETMLGALTPKEQAEWIDMLRKIKDRMDRTEAENR